MAISHIYIGEQGRSHRFDRSVSLAIVIWCLFCEVALASEGELKPPAITAAKTHASQERSDFFDVGGWGGGGVQLGGTEGPVVIALGASALFITDWLAVGVSGECDGVLFSATQEYASVLGGITWGLNRWFRLDTLVATGLHFEQPDSGIDLFAESRIVGGEEFFYMPFIGARVVGTFIIPPSAKTRFILGIQLEVKQDIGNHEPRFMVERCSTDWFSGDHSCRTSQESYRTGSFHFTLVVSHGVEFDLGA